MFHQFPVGLQGLIKLVRISLMSRARLLDICFTLCKAPVVAFLFHLIGILELQCVGIFPGFLYTDLLNFPSLY